MFFTIYAVYTNIQTYHVTKISIIFIKQNIIGEKSATMHCKNSKEYLL